MTEYTHQPFEDDVPLCGPGVPEVDSVDDLIRLLVTVRHRWGNTCVNFSSIQWGASSLHMRDHLRAALVTMRDYAKTTQDYWDKDEDSKVGKRLLAMSGQREGYDKEIDNALSKCE